MSADTKSGFGNYVDFKLLWSFPNAVFDKEAGTVTISSCDLLNLLARNQYLEGRRMYPDSESEPEPPRISYREGGWMDDNLPI